jgi:4-hydroxy-4-methyl-2-oxoglutarate aldolase
MANTNELLAELEKVDTPSVTNVVATYPNNPLCLGIYNPWSENWYTDQTIKCMYPELGPRVGFAVTSVFGLPDPSFSRLTFLDVIDAMEASPQPTILALEQKFPPEFQSKVGLCGGIMTTTMQTIGCIGVVSNGPSRDIDEIRPMKFQYLLSGITAGHGDMAVQSVNAPVSIAGMDVAPGEIIHMDENGACKFPANRLEEVVTNVKALLADEEASIARIRQAKNAAEIRAAMSTHNYGKEKGK